MTTPNIAADLITPHAIDSLAACNSLRKFHDVTQTLIKNQQLGLDFAPKRNNAFALPVALLVCYMSDSRRESLIRTRSVASPMLTRLATTSIL